MDANLGPRGLSGVARLPDPATHRSTYDRHAHGWDAQRIKDLYEKPWLDRALEPVPKGGAVLDLGCGAGDPIARYLIDQGYVVTGVDFAPTMLDICKTRWPDNRWIEADMTRLDLPEKFDAIIGWDSFFHLTPDQQRQTLPRLLRHLNRNGRLLMTVGPRAGEVDGCVEGTQIYSASLAPDEYAAILTKHESELVLFVPEDPSCHGRTVLLAQRNA